MDETKQQTDRFLLDDFRTVEFTFQNMGIYNKIWNHFGQCRDERKFTDIEIQVDGVSFFCHKILLDACCPYFQAYFSFCDLRGMQDKVVLKGVSLRGFTKLLDYMYTSNLSVTADDVIDVMQCADFLQFRELVHACSGFLLQHINQETCLKIFQLAQAHSLSDLKDAAWLYILTHFDQVLKTNEFNNAPISLVTNIVSSNHLDVESESQVLKAVIQWLFYDRKNRLQDFDNLLSKVRLTKDQLDSLDVSTKYGSHVYDTLLRHVGEKSSRLTEVIVVVGRDTHPGKHEKKDVFFHHPQIKRWQKLTALPFDHRHLFSVCVLNNKIFICGGVTNEVPLYDPKKEIFHEAWKYDMFSDTWKNVHPMIVARYHHSSASHHDKVYVVGGRSSKTVLRSDGEVYNSLMNQWTRLPLAQGINGIGNASLTALDGRLYLIGGTYSYRTATNELSSDTYTGAQCYDMSENRWHELPNLERQIDQHKLRLSMSDCVAFEGFLILLDDMTGKRLKLYNQVTKTLHDFVFPQGYHRFAGCAVYKDKLVCTGGMEEKFMSHDMVHYLDFNESFASWKMLCPLPVTMSHHACLKLYISLNSTSHPQTNEFQCSN